MRIYYINLSTRADRRLALEQRLSLLGLTGIRVEAATPDDVSAEMRRKYCDPTSYRWQTPPELACSLSHMRVMERLLATPDKYALVLEDDAILSTGLAEFLDHFERAAPDMDLVHLETDQAPWRLAPRPDTMLAGVSLYRAFNTLRGTAGYIVSRRAAEHILASDQLLKCMTDQALFNPFERPGRDLVVRQADPALVIQEEFASTGAGSDLVGYREQRFSRDAGNAWRRIGYNLFDLIYRDLWQPAVKAWHEYARGAARRVVRFK